MEKITTSKLSIEDLKALAAKKKADLTKQEQDELIRNMSIRERLERKLQTDEVELKLKDDLGEFSIKFRKLSPVEHDELAQLMGVLTKEPEKIKETTHAMLVILGGACLDPELNQAYWEAGKGFSGDVLNTAILQLKATSTLPDKKYLDEIIKFR